MVPLEIRKLWTRIHLLQSFFDMDDILPSNTTWNETHEASVSQTNEATCKGICRL